MGSVWSGVLGVCGVIFAIAAFSFSALAPQGPAAAQSSNPFDNTVESRARARHKAKKSSVNDRERFADPERASRPMFGPETERNLLAAIRYYESLVARGGWDPIPPGKGLGPGSNDPRVVPVRARLIMTGDLPRRVGTGYKYKAEVVEGVKRFQRRHGLKPTGRVYKSTLQALNIPAEQRLAQLKLNLERARKIARELNAKRYVVVNIPAYELQAISNGKVDLYSRVITGRAQTPTPVLKASIRALNFYPYWHVPTSIAVRQLAPLVARDPGYLQRERIRVFKGSGGEVDSTRISWSPSRARSYLFRQDPGPQNALGLLRLDMPNKHTVYMHDTPLQRLFRYGLRPYSAGCVRVHQVFELADWLLDGKDGWNARRIQNTIQAGKSETVNLRRPVPVHLVYLTAWGEPDGRAQFRVDIYNKDGTNKVVAEIEGSPADRAALTP